MSYTVRREGETCTWISSKQSLIDAMDAFFGGSSTDVPKRYDEASPIRRVTEDTPHNLGLYCQGAGKMMTQFLGKHWQD